MMKSILVLGTGGREYSIVKRLREDSIKLNEDINIICIQTNLNDKIKDYANLVIECNLMEDLTHTLVSIVNNNNIILSIVGSEDFLIKGVCDFFKQRNIHCMGPTLECSKLETSKMFCRTYIENIKELSKYNPKFSVYYSKKEFLHDLDTVTNKFNEFVIKKDGLHRGKGVYVQGYDFDNTIESISNLNLNDSILVIEEKLIGEEFSLMSLIDHNKNICHFPPIRDYKRLENENNGCNTGGMGCVIDKNNMLPFLSQEDIEECRNINEIVVNNFKFGHTYTGILYGSFIKTEDGIKIIEYNCRFGDPECIIALNLLENNFYDICTNFINGTLKPLNFSQDACICVYIVPKSYCKKAEENNKYDLYLNKELEQYITYSNIEVLDNHLYSLGSRCFALTYKSSNLYNCYQDIYNILNNIHGNIHYRTDIGKNFLSNYEASGVSIAEASRSLNEIKDSILDTYNDNVISEYGSFGGEYKLGDHILVSSIDGVGTKTLLSKVWKGVNGFVNLGRDIVGHSINDILVQGAEPLFFLDYYGCNNLNSIELKNFIKGVSIECNKHGKIPILGGETAEMSKVYKKDCIDLIGCILGLKNSKFFKQEIKSGDLIINLPSIGPHTNGFTLINNLVDNNTPKEIIDTLLNPHKCYLKEVHTFIDIFGFDSVHAMCHITGGGLYDNLNRVIKNKEYDIHVDFDNLPLWCKYLKEKGNISNGEMLNVFNCGYGFLLIVDNDLEDELTSLTFEYEIVGKIL
jgi:phosphoribosylamine--glycine ligase/phosphoribosylaminoimidazole synthetase